MSAWGRLSVARRPVDTTIPWPTEPNPHVAAARGVGRPLPTGPPTASWASSVRQPHRAPDTAEIRWRGWTAGSTDPARADSADTECGMPSAEHRTSNTEHRTSNIEHRTSNPDVRGEFSILDVRFWMFDVASPYGGQSKCKSKIQTEAFTLIELLLAVAIFSILLSL